MPIYRLSDDVVFPPAALADAETGILAVGGDLSPQRLMLAYSMGIFPWYDEETNPILWHAPRERMVLEPHALHVGRSLKKRLRKAPFELRWDTAFSQVLGYCAHVPRADQDGTWLNDDMRRAYQQLHRLGFAHSAEAWLDGRLVGGLYGVTLGGVFYGESMFALADDASKVVFVETVRALAGLGYTLVDCQIYTEHLARFGAVEWPQRRFQVALEEALAVQPSAVWPSNEP